MNTEKLPYAMNYQDLLAHTKSFPKEELYSLTDQLRRASRSVGDQIAEAWGKRIYIRHFISKLTDASAELNETEHWLDIANKCEYISESTKGEITYLCNEINRLVNGMIVKANNFCDNQ